MFDSVCLCVCVHHLTSKNERFSNNIRASIGFLARHFIGRRDQ